MSAREQGRLEVEDKENSVRCIFRRNPERAKEIKENRDDKIKRVEEKIEELNRYLADGERDLQIIDVSSRQ